jgi:hypothetical protein
MANEFKHKDPGSELTQAEFIASDGTGHIFDSQAQGDILYATSTTELARLGKDTNDSRVLTNTGTNNNPAWAQIALATGVSGSLPVANGGTAATSAGIAAFNSITTNADLTGVVTSDGNATSIAAKALAISKLADGTDGQLITWGTDAVITTVAAGSATQVLTSNGADNVPTFQDAGSGISGTDVVWVGWTYSGGTPAIADDVGVASLGDDGVGHIQINLDETFTAGYAVSVNVQSNTTSTTTSSNVGTDAYDIYMWDQTNSVTDAYGSSIAIGDLA